MATVLGQQPPRGTRRHSAGISAVLDVLDTLDRHGPVTLAQLSRETGVAKSTLHRVCSTMGERGWITRDSVSGNIELGPRVAWLARAIPASVLTASFYGVARRLVERHNETTCLTILDGCETVFIAKQETTHPVRLVTAVGSRLPAFASGLGSRHARRPSRARGRGDVRRAPSLSRRREAARRAGRAGRSGAEARCAAAMPKRRRRRSAFTASPSLSGRPAASRLRITFCVPTGRMNLTRKREMIADLFAAARDLAPTASGAGRLVGATHQQDFASIAQNGVRGPRVDSTGKVPT